jgi:GTP cyclohydrolase II
MINSSSARFLGSKCEVPTRWGLLRVTSISLTPASDGDLLVQFPSPKESVEKIGSPLVRIHSECVFAEALGSSICDCASQLDSALRMLQAEGGILFYLRYDGRGAGLAAKVAATQFEIAGMDTYESRIAIGVEPEGREFGPVGALLRKMGYTNVRVVSNSPLKIAGISRYLTVDEVIPLRDSDPNPAVAKLYETKREKFGHSL